MLISTAALRARFDLSIGNLTELRNNATGDNYIKSKPDFPIMSVIANINGTKEEWFPDSWTTLPSSEGLLLRCDKFAGEPVIVELRIQAVGEELHLSSSFKNESKHPLIEFLMPRISGLTLGSSHEDNTIIYPHHAGEKTKNPVAKYAEMATLDWKRFWRSAPKNMGGWYRREINYCGLASMTWMYLYDKDNGLYIGSHDGRFPVTGIIAETSGNEHNPWTGFAFRKHKRLMPGGEWNSGEYVLALSQQDWHAGAKRYRTYIDQHIKQYPVPAFLKDEFALNQCYNFKRAGGIEHRFADIPQMFAAGKEWGVRHMFIASWNRTGFDSNYPEYYPDMELGTAMEFARGLQHVRASGGFSTLYINARIFDRASVFHPTLGHKMAIRQADGSTIEESYGPFDFTVSCPSDQLWHDTLLDTAEFAVRAYGADGIYLDQLASAEPFACHSEMHSHEDIGLFNQGYLSLMHKLLKRMEGLSETPYLMVENCGDIYSSLAWGSLTWNGAEYDEHFNVFKFTFPEFTQVNMANPRGWMKESPEKIEWFYKDMQRAIVLGSVLWLGITSRLTPGTPYHDYAKQALGFREKLQPYLRDATFVDDAYISQMPAGTSASCWDLADGRKLLIAGNYALADGKEVCFKLPDAFTKIECYDIDWKMVDMKANGAELVLSMNGQRFLCVVVS